METYNDEEAPGSTPPAQEDIDETLCLLPIPGMREAILAGMMAPVSELSTELDW